MQPSNYILSLYSGVHALVSRLLKPGEEDHLSQAFMFACDKIAGNQAMMHILDACYIGVAEINLSGKAISSLFYSAGLKASPGAALPRAVAGSKVADIVQGLAKIEAIDTSNTRLHTDNLLKLVLAQAVDARAVLIQMACKLSMLRQLPELEPQAQKLLCRELKLLYAPLAHRLGLYAIKTEMEETSMKYLNNEIYLTIASKLAENKKDREEYIENFIDPLRLPLSKLAFPVEIKGRPKSIYSIWNKLKNNKVQFENIYDLFAIRLIIDCPKENEKPECWNAYSIVSDIYRPNPNRLRDWISSPKASGYESLHITVIGPAGKWVEVQIRSKRMDEIAEKGHAAHWKYKEGEKAEGSTGWLSKLRTALETDDATALEDESTSRIDLYSDEIFVFSPAGDLVRLKQGSTLLDFAFAMHTDMGSTCVGGKINGKVATIKQELRNGDRIEIQTSKNQTPKQDWLHFVKSSKARSKIKKFLRESQFAHSEAGKEMLMRKLGQIKVKFGDDSVYKMVKHFKAKDALDLYLMAAADKIEASELRDIFLEPEKLPQDKKKQSIDPGFVEKNLGDKLRAPGDNMLVIDNNTDKIEYTLAKCCSPIRGDEIFGFISTKSGIKIHRLSCPNASEMQNKFPYRLVKVAWSAPGAGDVFTVGVRVTGVDQLGIMNTITQIISSDLKVDMRSLSVNTRDGNFEAKMQLHIKDNMHLDKLLSKLKGIRGVHSAERAASL
jgi:GTP diphosphokinase / guanosine-3',5'-bis(diphosphate) 3'-diphosphatase